MAEHWQIGKLKKIMNYKCYFWLVFSNSVGGHWKLFVFNPLSRGESESGEKGTNRFPWQDKCKNWAPHAVIELFFWYFV